MKIWLTGLELLNEGKSRVHLGLEVDKPGPDSPFANVTVFLAKADILKLTVMEIEKVAVRQAEQLLGLHR